MSAVHFIVPIDFATEEHERTITDVVKSCPNTNFEHECELIRVTLGVPKSMREELRILMEDTGIETMKDLFNNALTLYAWMIANEQAGNRIASVGKENGDTIITTFEKHKR